MTDFYGDQANIFFWKKKSKMAIFQNHHFQNHQFSIFFVKFSWIDPWVELYQCPLHQSILPIFMIILVSSKRVSVRNNLLHSVLGLACSGRPHSAIIKRILFDKDNNAPSAWWRPCGASAVVATADNVIKPNSLSFSN